MPQFQRRRIGLHGAGIDIGGEVVQERGLGTELPDQGSARQGSQAAQGVDAQQTQSADELCLRRQRGERE